MYQCSAGELRDFAQGKIWQTLLTETQLWKESILDDLSSPTFNPAKDAMSFAREDRVLYDEYLRGCLLALERFRSLPNDLADALESELEQPPHKEEDLSHE